MDFNGDKGSPTMEAALVELDKMREAPGLLNDVVARPLLADLFKRMRVIDALGWLDHLVVALQAFRSTEIAAVIQAIPMKSRPMRAHSYRCKTYRGSSQPFDESDECTCGYRKQREERLRGAGVLVVLDSFSPALDSCWACGHGRVFHQVGTGAGVPVGVGYCDDRHGDKCECTRFIESRVAALAAAQTDSAAPREYGHQEWEAAGRLAARQVVEAMRGREARETPITDTPSGPSDPHDDADTPLDELVPLDRHSRFCFQDDLDFATRGANAYAVCCHQNGMVGANGVDDRQELVAAHLAGFTSGVSYYAAQIRDHRRRLRQGDKR